MNDLLAAARGARDRAYAPYSGYHVGAAIRDESGRIWAGCNVECASYGGTICAERGAVMAMIAGGGRRIAEILVLTADGGSPCGICRQVLAEFADPETPVRIVGDGGERASTVGALLPDAFRL